MLPKIVKRALKHIYKQAINIHMDSYQNDWHVVIRDETVIHFKAFTYGDESSDFDTWEDLVDWAHFEYVDSRYNLPYWDCSGRSFISNYWVNDLPKMGNVCVVIFEYSFDI